MSIWNCTTHGRTGPIACCGAAVRESSTAAETPVVAVTAPTPDAVAQARAKVLNTMHEVAIYADGSDQGPSSLFIASHVIPNLDALIAAVRAECAADTKRLDWMERKVSAFTYRGATEVEMWTEPTIRAALDAAMGVDP